MNGYDPHRPSHSTGSSSRHQQHVPPRQDAGIDTQYQAAPTQLPRRRRAVTAAAAARPRSQTHLSVPEPTRHRSTDQVHGPEPMIRGYSSGSAGSMTRRFESLTTTEEGEAQSPQKGAKRGRRTKKLDPQTRDHAARVRGVGACSECRSRKVKCKHRDHMFRAEGNEAVLVPSLASPGVSECEEPYTPTTNSQCGDLSQGMLPGGLADGPSPCPMSDPGVPAPLESDPAADVLTGLRNADQMSLSMSPSGMMFSDNNEEDRALQRQIPLRPQSNEYQLHTNLGSGAPWSANIVYQYPASTYPDNSANTYTGISVSTYPNNSANPYTGMLADTYTENSVSEYSADYSTERIMVGKYVTDLADDNTGPNGAWLCQSPNCDFRFHLRNDLQIHYQTLHQSFNEQDAREVYRCSVCDSEPDLHSRRCDTWGQAWAWTKWYEYYLPMANPFTANTAGPATFDGNPGGSWSSGGFNGFGGGGYFGGAGSSASARNPGNGGYFIYGDSGGSYSYRACATKGRVALAGDEDRAGPPRTGKMVLRSQQMSRPEAWSAATACLQLDPVLAAMIGNCIRRMILEELRKIMSFARLTQDPSPNSQRTLGYWFLGAPCLAACLYGPSRWLVGALTRTERRADTEKEGAAIHGAGEGDNVVAHPRVEPATGWQSLWGFYIRCISGV